jgi:hypothetical protein
MTSGGRTGAVSAKPQVKAGAATFKKTQRPSTGATGAATPKSPAQSGGRQPETRGPSPRGPRCVPLKGDTQSSAMAPQRQQNEQAVCRLSSIEALSRAGVRDRSLRMAFNSHSAPSSFCQG